MKVLDEAEAREQLRLYIISRREMAFRAYEAIDNRPSAHVQANIGYHRGVIAGLEIALDAMELDNIPGALSTVAA